MLGSDEAIKMESINGKFLITILVEVDGIAFGIDVGTELGTLDGSFSGSHNSSIEVLLLGYAKVYTDGKVLSSHEVIKLV